MRERGVSGKLRPAAAPFVAAAPAGRRVRTRLRVSGQDAAVLWVVGSHLGSLAGRDLRARSAEGRLDARGRAVSRRERKRRLTSGSSSRWAGAITRTTEDQVQLAERNLAAERSSLQTRIRRVEVRLAVPAGGRDGRMRGYPTQAERHRGQQRLRHLRSRLARVEQQLDTGVVGVCRGGRRLARTRHNLTAVGVTLEQWRDRWEAGRLFLTADGEKEAHLGNETIRWHPGERWLEIKLPPPLGHLANRPHGRYRLSCPVALAYRSSQAAAQAESGAIRYDIRFDPAKSRWYLDASWRTPQLPVPSLEQLRQAPVLAVDLNHGHLAGWIITPEGNPHGPPITIPLHLAGLPATQRDGRLRAAVSELIRIAHQHGCHAIAIEDLDFAQARAVGREGRGNRPSRGQRGKAFRRIVAGIPTARFRDRLTQMASNKGLAVIAVDPAYTSRWGSQHWLTPLRDQNAITSGHHAAAVVIGRRAYGHRARRRAGVTGADQRISRRRATPQVPQVTRAGRNGGIPPGPTAATTVAQDRPGPPGTPTRPGSPRPFGATGQPGPSPAVSLRNGTLPPGAGTNFAGWHLPLRRRPWSPRSSW
jgi:IS605 OrfB family transposase